MKNRHLLIADDDRVILAMLAEDLLAHGYQVQTAANGAEAVTACKQNPPDLAILDIRMPVMNGIDAARILREECGTSALFLSAYSDNELVDQAVAEGALGYLVKPINTEKLLPAISAALARAEDLRSSQQMQQNLTLAMKSKREIDVAVGILLERFNLNRDQSFQVLRRLARSTNRKIEDIATDLISRGELLSMARKFSEEAAANPTKSM